MGRFALAVAKQCVLCLEIGVGPTAFGVDDGISTCFTGQCSPDLRGGKERKVLNEPKLPIEEATTNNKRQHRFGNHTYHMAALLARIVVEKGKAYQLMVRIFCFMVDGFLVRWPLWVRIRATSFGSRFAFWFVKMKKRNQEDFGPDQGNSPDNEVYTTFNLYMTSFHSHNFVLCDGQDVMFRLWNSLMLFLPLHRITIYDGFGNKVSETTKRGDSWPLWPFRLWQIELCFIFIGAGLGKLSHERWRNGTAMYHIRYVSTQRKRGQSGAFLVVV